MSYDNETPMNDKFLMADGSIRNANGQTYNYTASGSSLTFDITLKKESTRGDSFYKVTAEFKDRGSVYAPLNCFLVVGELN